MDALLDSDARQVLARYPLLAHLPLRPVERPGFSGARLWRLEEGAYLRAWPPGESAARLGWIHGLLERARRDGLLCVPAIFSASSGATVVEFTGRCWEAGTWQPGSAVARTAPPASSLRVANACRTMARLHLAWSPEMTAPLAPIPALLRRRQVLHAVAEQVRSADQPGGIPLDPTGSTVHRATILLRRWLPSVPSWLERYATVPFPLQPCHGDPWRENVLFTADDVTGLIDYGAVRIDHPAVDLARLLGSLACDDLEGWRVGLNAYREVCRLSHDEADLARVLDQSGTVLALGRWLTRLSAPTGSLPERRQLVERLEELLQRVEAW